jgi:hypothetical protein
VDLVVEAVVSGAHKVLLAAAVVILAVMVVMEHLPEVEQDHLTTEQVKLILLEIDPVPDKYK